MNWEEELLKRNFVCLESSTRTYGNGIFTGSIVYEKWDGKFLTIVDEPGKNVKEIFCPFLHTDDKTKPNHNFQTIRLRNAEEIDTYINEKEAQKS